MSAERGRRRRSIATVCLSGTLEDKLARRRGAGFDGIEVFEPDLIASPVGPGGARRPLRRPRPVDRPLPALPRPGLHRPRTASRATSAAPSASSTSWRQLGADDRAGLLRRSRRDAVADLDRLAEQLAAAAARAGERGLRIAYEALAWGAARLHLGAVVGRRPAGPTPPRWALCLDSFHVLSRGGDPAGFAACPARSCSSCSSPTPRSCGWTCCSGAATTGSSPARAPSTWPASPARVLGRRVRRAAVARGLQRRLPAVRPGAHRRRRACARCCGSRSSWPAAPRLGSRAPAAAGADRLRRSPSWPSTASPGRVVADALRRARFAHTGQHRSKPVQLLAAGPRPRAAQRLRRPAGRGRRGRGRRPRRWRARTRAGRRHGREALRAPVLPRTRGAAEADLVRDRRAGRHPALLHPHRPRRLAGRLPGRPASAPEGGAGLTAVDHVGAHPALRLLRRGRPVLPGGARAGAAGGHRVRRAVRAGPQPRGRPIRRGRSGWRSASPLCAAGTGPPECPTRSTSPSRPTTSSPPPARCGRPALRCIAAAGQLRRRPRRPLRPRPGPARGHPGQRAHVRRGRPRRATCTWPPRCSAIADLLRGRAAARRLRRLRHGRRPGPHGRSAPPPGSTPAGRGAVRVAAPTRSVRPLRRPGRRRRLRAPRRP